MEMKPLPRLNAINRPFFEACNRGTMELQQCAAPACRRFIYYPRVCCPYCGGGVLAWRPVSGRGRIAGFTVVHRPQHASFRAEAPYAFVAVTLDEGPLLYSRLVEPVPPGVDVTERPVRAVFVDHAPGWKLPFFALA